MVNIWLVSLCSRGLYYKAGLRIIEINSFISVFSITKVSHFFPGYIVMIIYGVDLPKSEFWSR